MKLYVKAWSSYKGNLRDIDVKQELKSRYKLDTRRQDTFIHLAIYGSQLLRDKIEIAPNDELYVTSGVGNIDVLQKTFDYVKEQKEFIKPFDFINMLGNTTSYYVANSLGLRDKNTFQISNNFTVINTLISVFASLNISGNEAIMGSIDLCSEQGEVIKRVLGVDEDVVVTSSVNYQKFSLSKENALAFVEFDAKIYTKDEIKALLKETQLEIITSMRCTDLEQVAQSEFFETMASYFINYAIENQKDMLYVDCFDESYKVIKIVNLL